VHKDMGGCAAVERAASEGTRGSEIAQWRKRMGVQTAVLRVAGERGVRGGACAQVRVQTGEKGCQGGVPAAPRGVRRAMVLPFLSLPSSRMGDPMEAWFSSRMAEWHRKNGARRSGAVGMNRRVKSQNRGAYAA